MCFCEYETPEFSSTEYRTARTKKQCCECGESIKPGDVYERHVTKWEGDVGSYVTCSQCWLWRRAFMEAQQRECGCSGWPIEAMWSEIAEFCWEHLGYNPRWQDEEAA